MREVNFSIPNVNKASVGITTALYDRRALDCTSTLPLINSLNHLAYLTTSSARIRDILCIDGGVERLVSILKQGRCKEMMEMWKWNLAFQCVVNIGVRGSETVRTRVVEADMVPVIATLLNNYIQIIDYCREKADSEARRSSRHSGGVCKTSWSSSFRDGASRHGHERASASADLRTIRRQAPPPSIEIPQALSLITGDGAMEVTPTPTQMALPTPERSPRPRQGHSRHLSYQRSPEIRPFSIHRSFPPPPPPVPTSAAPTSDPVEPLRPVRDVDRLPSMLPSVHSGPTSQPESPTTPNAPVAPAIAGASRHRRRDGSTHQQQPSISGDSDDGSTDINGEDQPLPRRDSSEQPMVDIQPAVNIEGADENQAILEAVEAPMELTGENGSEGQDTTAFNLTHRTGGLDGSIIATNITPTPDAQDGVALRQAQPAMPPMATPSPATSHSLQGRYLLDRTAPPGVLAALPRDEDVLMSLQLLAYVSKYCNLRTYFQKSHLVPKLKIDKHFKLFEEGVSADRPVVEESNEREYLLPDDFNIFPLVEKFTVRHHSQDMQYWAGVVMRNLCRKDESKGGIRQCAHYKCGKWEEWTRQFAKCRRCRRTKYCSKDCQKNAWVYHRHWCQMANS